MSTPNRVISLIDIMKAYKIAKFKDTEQMLQFVAKKRKLMAAGDVPKLEEAAVIVMDDLIDGKIKYFTEVPEN